MALRRAGRTWEILEIMMNSPKAWPVKPSADPAQMLIRLAVTPTIFLTFFVKDK